jgi:cysteine synthase A
VEKIAKNITKLVGKTPLVHLERFSAALGIEAKLVGKLECMNPLGSVKDRIAVAMVEQAEKSGELSENSVIVEATSGNTGIGLAFVAASKGYKLILAMPESMSTERRALLAALGAELVLTPASLGMKGATEKVEEIAGKLPNCFRPRQFENPENALAHYRTTAQEIWDDTDGKVGAVVCGVGTGGTVTGVGQKLKQYNPDIRIYAAEPFSSPVLSGGSAGPHGIQGIGPGFVPKILDTTVLDGIIKVRDEEAKRTTRLLAACEGLLVGISSGAAAFAAQKVSQLKENRGKLIVALLPDTGERYLSTGVFSPQQDDYLEVAEGFPL